MGTSPSKTPLQPRTSNRAYLSLLRIVRKMLIVFYLSMGVALLLSSYLVWKNNDLIPAILGVALFLFAGISFLAQGIRSFGKGKRKGTS